MKTLQVFLVAALMTAQSFAVNDKIFLKSGDVVEGEIVSGEGADPVEIRVRQGTITEKRRIPRADIDRIEVPTPDDVAFEKIKDLVPAPSLLKPDAYQRRIETVKNFISEFPESPHKPAAEKILNTLQEEQDQANKGFLKLRGEWISPKAQELHEENVEAEILQYKIENAARQDAYQSALRQFEEMEEEYRGTRAYPDAIETVRQILPAYAASLRREIEYQRYYQSEQEKKLPLLTDAERREYEESLERSHAQYESLREQEKEAGITWLTPNPKEEKTMLDTIALAEKEAKRLSELDVSALREQADGFYEVEALLAEEKIDEAKTVLEKTLSEYPSAVKADGSDFVVGLQAKIDQVEEEAAQAKSAAETAGSNSAEPDKNMAKTEAGDTAEEKETASDPLDDDPLSAIYAERKKAEESKKAAAPKPKKEEEKKKPAPKEEKEETAEIKRPTPAPSGGGGLPFNPIYILPVILIPATVILYLREQKKKQGG